MHFFILYVIFCILFYTHRYLHNNYNTLQYYYFYNIIKSWRKPACITVLQILIGIRADVCHRLAM
jgi:hypothetical protein